MKIQQTTGIKELCPAPENLLKQMYLAAVFNSIILNKYLNLSHKRFKLHGTGVFQANLVRWYSIKRDGEMLLGNTWLYAAHSERSDWNALEMEAEEATIKYYAQNVMHRI